MRFRPVHIFRLYYLTPNRTHNETEREGVKERQGVQERERERAGDERQPLLVFGSFVASFSAASNNHFFSFHSI